MGANPAAGGGQPGTQGAAINTAQAQQGQTGAAGVGAGQSVITKFNKRKYNLKIKYWWFFLKIIGKFIIRRKSHKQ